MNMNELPAAQPAASPEVFQQLGVLTRQLHDTLSQLGVMPKLQQSAEGLSDARSRLTYIARKTGEAADKVLTAVELAKREQSELVDRARRISTACADGTPQPVSHAEIAAFAALVEQTASRIDAHLTDIMLAQDFHDLTGQVVGKVVSVAMDMEDSLVKLLVQVAPSELISPAETELAGPVVEGTGRVDVVTNQGEVDDLLASMGF